MGSSKGDAEREYQREHCCEDDTCLDNYSTKELVDELRKREGVDAIENPHNRRGPAIILRIID